MSAKNKRASRATAGDVIPPGNAGREESGMYLRALRYREELVEEARSLRRAGRIRAARGAEGRVHQLEQLLGALEGERPTPSSASAPES